MPAAPRSRRLRLTLIGVGSVALLPIGLSPAVAQDPTPAASSTVVGTVVRAWADPRIPSRTPKAESAKPLTWIEPAKGDAVRVPTEQAAQLPLGSTVKVSVGDEVTDAATKETGVEPARQVLTSTVVAAAAPAPALPASAPYTNEVTVVMVRPAGDPTPDSRTADQVVAAVNGPVADFWQSQSRGSIRIHATAYSASWMSTTAGCDQPTQMWDEVSQAVGFATNPPAPGKHLLLYLPEGIDAASGCEMGLGEVGTAPGDGGRTYVSPVSSETLATATAHELGHNFGLGHSSELQCDKSIDTGSKCGVASYMDLYDVMGASWEQVGSLSAPQADLLGLLPHREIVDLEGTHGTRDVSLAPMSKLPTPDQPAVTRAVRLGANDGNVYWLEYRTAAGQDSWLGDPLKNNMHLQTGVSIRIEDNSDDTSLLLDATPSAAAGWRDDWASALASGRSVWLSGLDYYVTVKSATSSGAVVRVQAGDGAMPRDLNRNYLPDLVTADSAGTLYLYNGTGAGGFGARTTLGKGWTARDLITQVGDWDGSGNSQDLIARDPQGNLWFYPGNGRGGFGSQRIIGGGWQAMSGLLAPGDWNGDGFVDLLARRRSDNALYLYPGNGAGGFKPTVKIGAGWGSMTAFVATGDWDLNGTADFVTRRSDGALVLYLGNGTGGFAGSTVIGNGWNIFNGITGVGDWDGDGAPDLLARKTDGSLLLYTRAPDGILRGKKIGSGWSGYRLAV